LFKFGVVYKKKCSVSQNLGITKLRNHEITAAVSGNKVILITFSLD